MSGEREEKKLVYVPKSLVDRLIEVARRSGTPISKLVEYSISHFLKVNELGYSFEEALETLKAFKYLKALGGVFTPKPVLECFESYTCTTREEKLKRWREAGKAYGMYLRETSGSPVKTLKALLEVSRWDLSEVEVSDGGDFYKLRCVSPALNEEDTAYLAEFIRGILEGLDTQIGRVEFTRGLVIAEFAAPRR
ncbi:MAG: hypothetical protein QXH02_00165 [Desulfurococcaceae archaeon]